jgi:hypothetical protein
VDFKNEIIIVQPTAKPEKGKLPIFIVKKNKIKK